MAKNKPTTQTTPPDTSNESDVKPPVTEVDEEHPFQPDIEEILVSSQVNHKGPDECVTMQDISRPFQPKMRRVRVH